MIWLQSTSICFKASDEAGYLHARVAHVIVPCDVLKANKYIFKCSHLGMYCAMRSVHLSKTLVLRMATSIV